jgi:regulatory protein
MTSEKQITQMRVVNKRGSRRVVVETDDGAVVEVDPEIVVRHGIKSGAAVSDQEIETWQREDELLRARQRLTNYLALRVKSVADARLYLEKTGFSEVAVASAVARAVERDLLDDRRFAERYVRTKIKMATVGPLRLVGELVSHGIEPSLAEHVVESEYGHDRQVEVAARIAAKRVKKGFGNTDKNEVVVVYDLLLQRGFDEEVAAEVAERATR